MLLTDHTVVDYLVGRRLLTRAALVADQIHVRSNTTRHTNYVVRREYKGGFFIKQVKSWNPAAREMLAREAAWYRVVAALDEAAGVRALMPRFSLWDPDRAILVLDLIDNAQRLDTAPRADGVNSVAAAAQLARMLVALHAHNPRAWPLAAHRFRLPYRFPNALTLDQRSPADAASASGGERMLLVLLHQHPAFTAELTALRSEWKQECVVHGDLRWANCLILDAAAAGGEPKLRLIDWELVDCGARAWDTGGVLQCWLSSWIGSMPDTDAPPSELVRAASWSLAEMRPAIAAFWSAYLRAARVHKNAARGLLLRSVKYAAARLLQTTLEEMHDRPMLTNRGLCGMQLGLNILNDPARAITDLLGLG